MFTTTNIDDDSIWTFIPPSLVSKSISLFFFILTQLKARGRHLQSPLTVQCFVGWGGGGLVNISERLRLCAPFTGARQTLTTPRLIAFTPTAAATSRVAPAQQPVIEEPSPKKLVSAELVTSGAIVCRSPSHLTPRPLTGFTHSLRRAKCCRVDGPMRVAAL